MVQLVAAWRTRKIFPRLLPVLVLLGALTVKVAQIQLAFTNQTATDDVFLSGTAQSLGARNPKFRVLCTAKAKILGWGSYKIRCKDFQFFAAKYFPQVEIDAVDQKKAIGQYNATVMVKVILPSNSTNGRIFVDIVDELFLHKKKQVARIPSNYEILVQNKFQAEVFPNHKTHIVTHWFNSFPADDQDEPKGPLPEIEPVDILRVGTVWNPPRREKGCRSSTNGMANVTYKCIEENFAIEGWYLKYVNDTKNNMSEILKDPNLGPGFLYRNLFRQFHVLVIYPKPGKKMKYNSYQRVVSQMRSGVPVLMDCRGENHQDFCQRYRYPCNFTDQASFTDMLERMKDVKLRKECQHMGIEISSK